MALGLDVLKGLMLTTKAYSCELPEKNFVFSFSTIARFQIMVRELNIARAHSFSVYARASELKCFLKT